MSLESHIESRIKKLEERFRDLKDSNAENISSIEDLYDTINNIKSNGYNSSSDEDYLPSSTSRISSSIADRHCDISNKQGGINNIGSKCNILEEYKSTDIKELKLEQLLEYVSTIYSLEDTTNPDRKLKIKDCLDYFIQLTPDKRHTIIELLTNHKTQKHQIKPTLFTILESSMSDYHKQFVISKLKMLEQMDVSDAEYYKLKQWLDNLLAIPFGNYIEPDFINSSKPSEVLTNATEIMDGAIYGQHRTKQHILEIVARMISNPSARGTVFAVEGEPGTGKTSLIKRGLAPIFGLPFQFISLGGARDMAYLAGENYTYIGSKPGLIVHAIRQAKCMNPIFYFDELDKVSDTPHGQEIINLLIHITDPAQNEHFQDVYLDGIPIDLSRALFIFSFNNRAMVNPILLDRMEIIKFDKYTYADKVVITEKYLLPELITDYFGNCNVKVILKDKCALFKKLILSTRRIGNGVNKIRSTCGIRCIMRRLEKVIARINLEELRQNARKMKKRKIVIQPTDLDLILL